jgi:hypothetical protein
MFSALLISKFLLITVTGTTEKRKNDRKVGTTDKQKTTGKPERPGKPEGPGNPERS